MAKEEKILHYLDIPIQHCSDRLIKLMNRKGGRQFLLNLFAKIRDRLPDICLRTSLITGFPSETEEEFTELCRFIEEVRFDRMGVFAFSPQEGTPAYTMEGQIEEETKRYRQEILMNLQNRISSQINERQMGKTLTVLCEGTEEGRCYGRSYKDSPDIDPKVYFSSEHPVRPGEFIPVNITGHDDYDLTGIRE
ncbi:Ribosomal protein S12 methylthiotransferase RimO [bioreactor metagenome]|uniref:Ribosomal protein S12 methylthiotransferase RimO n=1 Tax=bioreactor metagenome TaxID=1076179 RepID=A0A645H622_9ZZZZ